MAQQGILRHATDKGETYDVAAIKVDIIPDGISITHLEFTKDGLALIKESNYTNIMEILRHEFDIYIPDIKVRYNGCKAKKIEQTGNQDITKPFHGEIIFVCMNCEAP
ncbi:hypothetical protein HF289_10520 [Acidithiobacillus ferrooxidans]|nr:hypothetical protein [Acidithiobacillus ferrooxidans]